MSPYGNRVFALERVQLPHMVAEFGRYAVTLRCANSLPKSILERTKALHQDRELHSSKTEEMRLLQRKLFLTLEKYDDAGLGFAPFAEGVVATQFYRFLETYARDGLRFTDWTIMPNHVHLVTDGVAFDGVARFVKAWRALKGISGKQLNQQMGRSGPFWQTEWYDRLIRDEVEYRKWKAYIAANPVKAGLCSNWSDFPYTFIS
jgi:REP element-mobilizing transposase RayT